MARRDDFRTQAPREVTVILAAVLWFVGFADVILSAFALSRTYGSGLALFGAPSPHRLPCRFHRIASFVSS